MFYVSTGCAKPYNDWEKGAQIRLLMLFSLQWLVGLPWIFISLFLGTKALHNNCTSTLSRSRVTFPYAISADLMIPYQTRQSHHSYTCFTGGGSDRERLNDIPTRINGSDALEHTSWKYTRVAASISVCFLNFLSLFLQAPSRGSFPSSPFLTPLEL